MGVTEADRNRVRDQLKHDYVYFPEVAAWILNKRRDRVRLMLKRPQRRLARALMAQRDAGQPQRAVVLKSRQTGMSTLAQSIAIQRAVQNPNHIALTVAHRRDAAAGIFAIGQHIWSNLPAEIKPEVARQSDTHDRKYLMFGQPANHLRQRGVFGLNSTYELQTAKVAEGAGRSRTFRTVHLSEIAFWDSDVAMLGIENAVPDDPDTLIIKESTPRGNNWWKDEWDAAESGGSGYYPMFSPWFEEDEYRKPFLTDDERADFEAALGKGPYGEDEPGLIDLMTASFRQWAEEDGQPEPSDEEVTQRVYEHLNWRRWAIPSKTGRSVDSFHQEYSSTPEESFLSTGRRVFEARYVRTALNRVEAKYDPATPTLELPGPTLGLFRSEKESERKVRARRGVVIPVPQKSLWVPARKREEGETAGWRLWSVPTKERSIDGQRQPEGQYLIGVDPASGQEDEKGVEHADHAVTIIDHRTLVQVAAYTSQEDPDELAYKLLLAALYFNRAWIVVERTGGYGLSMLRRLAIDYRYPRVFEEQSKDKRVEDRTERLGFSTDSVSKPLLEARALELLREEHDIFRDREMVRQMLTYIRDKRGRSKPEPGKKSDRLMSWMIAQYVATLRPVRPDHGPEFKRRSSTGGHKVRSVKAGW